VATVAEAMEGVAGEMAGMPTTEMPTTTDVPAGVAAVRTTMSPSMPTTMSTMPPAMPTTGEGDRRPADHERAAKDSNPENRCAFHAEPPSPPQG
jgi:hypothetical protein